MNNNTIIKYVPLLKGPSKIPEILTGDDVEINKKFRFLKGCSMTQMEKLDRFIHLEDKEDTVFSVINSPVFETEKTETADGSVDWSKTLTLTDYTRNKEDVYAFYCTFNNYVDDVDKLTGNVIGTELFKTDFIIMTNERTFNNRFIINVPERYPYKDISVNRMHHVLKMINIYGGFNAKLKFTATEKTQIKSKDDYQIYKLVNDLGECVNCTVYSVSVFPKYVWKEMKNIFKDVNYKKP